MSGNTNPVWHLTIRGREKLHIKEKGEKSRQKEGVEELEK
jgi:hypothetical protein